MNSNPNNNPKSPNKNQSIPNPTKQKKQLQQLTQGELESISGAGSVEMFFYSGRWRE